MSMPSVLLRSDAPRFVGSSSERPTADVRTTSMYQRVDHCARSFARTGAQHGAAFAHSVFLGVDCISGRGDHSRFFHRLTPAGQHRPVDTEPFALRKGLLGLGIETVKWSTFLAAATVGIAIGMAAGAALMLVVAAPSVITVGALMGTSDNYNDVPARCVQSNGKILNHLIASGGVVGLGVARSVCELVFQPLDGAAGTVRVLMRALHALTAMACAAAGACTYAMLGASIGLFHCNEATT